VQIGPFIVDFACLAHKLIVEADGAGHNVNRDRERDEWLIGQGFRVPRFPNATIGDRPDAFFRAIFAATQQG
jgi:very-short-patch-repair endonuclease